MDQESFLAEFLRQRTLLAGFIRAMIRDPHAAEDVFQETSMVLFREAGRFQEGTNFGAWSRSIARNRIKEHFHRRRQPLPLSEGAEQAVESAFDGLADDGLDDCRSALVLCLEKLGATARRVIDAYYGEDRDLKSVAVELDRTPLAVRIVLSRARAALRECADRRLAHGT